MIDRNVLREIDKETNRLMKNIKKRLSILSIFFSVFTFGCSSDNDQMSLNAPAISGFSVPTKVVGDVPFALTPPTSNSQGAFTYTSSNTTVAIITGNMLTILGEGISVITATQAANGNFSKGEASANIVVTSNSVSSGIILANNSLIEYNGRIDFNDPLQPKFSYSGSSVRAMFQGTSIKAVLSDDSFFNYYNVIVDGIVTKRINLTSTSSIYDLASGLSDGVHEIEIYKLTESNYGITTFTGFTLDAGKNLVPITTTRRLFLEYIGDSVTCGSGIEGSSTSSQSNTNQNHYLSYAAITSRNFNAHHLAVCKSGVGLFLNYTSVTVPADIESANSMNNYYDRMHWTAATPLYNFAKIPDMIFVNLGTNDFSKGVNDVKFEEAYYNFIDKLQVKSPGVDIVVLLGPMISGWNYTHFKPILQRITATANAKGKGKVHFFEMSQQGALGTGSQNHPNVAQHQKNAQELTDFIKTIKPSWK